MMQSYQHLPMDNMQMPAGCPKVKYLIAGFVLGVVAFGAVLLLIPQLRGYLLELSQPIPPSYEDCANGVDDDNDGLVDTDDPDCPTPAMGDGSTTTSADICSNGLDDDDDSLIDTRDPDCDSGTST